MEGDLELRHVLRVFLGNHGTQPRLFVAMRLEVIHKRFGRVELIEKTDASVLFSLAL
jgi:hypothetical protein